MSAKLERFVAAGARVSRLRTELAEAEADLDRMLAGTDLQRADVEYAVAQRAAEQLVEAERLDETRCPRCAWPYADSRENGCVPGDCSYRCGHRSAEGYRDDCQVCRYDRARAASNES